MNVLDGLKFRIGTMLGELSFALGVILIIVVLALVKIYIWDNWKEWRSRK